VYYRPHLKHVIALLYESYKTKLCVLAQRVHECKKSLSASSCTGDFFITVQFSWHTLYIQNNRDIKIIERTSTSYTFQRSNVKVTGSTYR